MSRGGLKPETIVRKQIERAELARDACRMKRCGLTYRQIGVQLGCSHEQVHRLVKEGIDAYKAEGKREAGEMLEAMIADLLKSSQELWIQWERSKQDGNRKTTKKTAKGTEVTKLTEGRLGDPRYMAEFRANMKMISELRGVLTDDDEEDVFETYQAEMEESFEPPPEVIEEQKSSQEQLSDDNSSAPENP